MLSHRSVYRRPYRQSLPRFDKTITLHAWSTGVIYFRRLSCKLRIPTIQYQDYYRINQEPRSSSSLEKFVKYLAIMDLDNNICPLRALVGTYGLSSAWMLNSETPILTPQDLQYDDTATGSWLAQVARASSTVPIKANTRLQGMRTLYTVPLSLWNGDDIFTVLVILFPRLYQNCSGQPCNNAASSCD